MSDTKTDAFETAFMDGDYAEMRRLYDEAQVTAAARRDTLDGPQGVQIVLGFALQAYLNDQGVRIERVDTGFNVVTKQAVIPCTSMTMAAAVAFNVAKQAEFAPLKQALRPLYMIADSPAVRRLPSATVLEIAGGRLFVGDLTFLRLAYDGMWMQRE